MNFKPLVIAAALLSNFACVKVDNTLGGNFVPVDQQYDVFAIEVPITDIDLKLTDSLSGYSSTRVVIGSIRDDEYGLTSRSSALTLYPLVDTLDFGSSPVVKRFHFALAMDTVSVSRNQDKHILQNVHVTSLSTNMAKAKLSDCNDVESILSFGSESIIKGSPVLNGVDSLAFDFKTDFAQNIVDKFNGKVIEEMSKEDYFDILPGIYIYTDEPTGNGGRINMYELQLAYDASQYTLSGNYAEMKISAYYPDKDDPGKLVQKDTSFFFFAGLQETVSIDSLMANGTKGKLPQYSFNATKHSTRSRAGKAGDYLYVEGGGGLKPVFSAKMLKDLAMDAIVDALTSAGRSADDAKSAIINKATIAMPYEYNSATTDLDFFPAVLSPTCRIKTDTTSNFMGLTDASTESENKGDVNYSLCQYAPDITYHLQQLLKTEDDNENLVRGDYDIWMLLMSYETTTTTNNTQNDMSEYYQYLAYQNYYNSMYGGYGGYGGYGYGGGNYYNNYYSYMMAAMYMSGNQTSTSTSQVLDKDRYFLARLNGPSNSSARKPSLKLTVSVPKK